jgi:carboxymethylenebutenolidase
MPVFVARHPTAQEPTMNSDTTINTPEGIFTAYIAKPLTLPAPIVVVLHEAFGVNPDIRATCDEIALQGFVAVAPDLYWRQEPGAQYSPNTEWQRGIALYEAMDINAAVRDVQNTVLEMRKADFCAGPVGVMGFCLGGLLTYLVAVRGGVEAGVCYHGGRTEEFLDEASALKGPVLMHLAELDEFISKEAQASIKKALMPRGVEVHTYAGCSHAFARHNGLHFDAHSAALANGRTIEFLKGHLVASAG